MKSKLLILIMLIIVAAVQLTIPVMAADGDVVEITRPEGNEVVTKDIFSICGVCIYDDTTIELSYIDGDTGKVLPLNTTDGKSSFKVGSNKIFAKDVQLKKGDNKIIIVATTKVLNEEKKTVVLSENKQFTISVGEEKKKGNWFTDTTEALTNWLKNN